MAKASAKNKSTSTTLHPPYLEMMADAISTLKERTGSSQQAIAKFIEEKHKKVLPPNFRKTLSLQLKNFVKSGKLYKVKNSYKLSSTENNNKEAQKTKTKTNNKKVPEKKTKRLSQVKTPEALKKKKDEEDATKKKSAVLATSAAGKVKRLSQVKTPEAMKKKPNLTPMKRKSTHKPINSCRPTKKARK